MTTLRTRRKWEPSTQAALIPASCCAGPIRSLVVVVVVVACCCCIPYRLALMPALTFAPCVLTFAPCTLTFAPCAYGVSLLSTGATIPLAQMVVVTSCNLRWWCYIYRAYAVAQSISLVGHVGGQPHVIRKRLHMWDRNFRVSLQVE